MRSLLDTLRQLIRFDTSIYSSPTVNSFCGIYFLVLNIVSCFLETIEVLEELVQEGSENMDVRNKDEVILRMRSSVASKQFGQEDKLCSLIAEVNLHFILFYAIS